MNGFSDFKLSSVLTYLKDFDGDGCGSDCYVIVGLFSVITKRGVGSLVLELPEMLHEAFSDTASGFSYVGGGVVGAVIASDFVNYVFGMALSCQPRFAGVTGAVACGAWWGL